MIEFKNVHKSFKNNTVLNNINLTINNGELLVLIGPSGCGKTTTLKMINKLISPTSGSILIDGEDISKKNTIELRRNIGYVIQQTGLFPHMNIGENIELVPYLKKWPLEKRRARSKELLSLVGLDPDKYTDRYPDELSGGQQQRVGVARALATNPDIILMDEPFSALDPITRNSLQEQVFKLQQELKKTIIFVTHDMDEALKLGDRICIMAGGDVIQFDTPENILRNPEKSFVEDFIGKNRLWNKPEFIKAEDIMIRNPITSSPNRTILQAIEIMKGNKVDSLLVVDNNDILIGIVTSKDIQGNITSSSVKLGSIMTKDLIYAKTDDSIGEILKIMNKNNVGFVPIVDENGCLKGLVTKSSLITLFEEKLLYEVV
ncbi:Glycine betaine/carnitine/choline transport ATP-binding protein OpuCA [Clostridium liquoris]|uniref:Quaternary amine transport ATP-binding protein n=1 Tax=Clostridium liquoris TaxID=1289519 RepID=A0A2T0B377_9CLOT|nr:ABC transporter ATP-binding protein [Clostridium liquoris]PRR78335.1 Glycine betaine/carnitine/choline transport ATP-binding protein OpuCA [Clostridium liquoris]